MNFAAGRITLPLAPALLALLVLAYLLPGLVGHDPWKTDDAIGIGIVHQMLEHGRWIVPYLAGEPFLEDGPFHYWIAALAANVFGLVLAPHDGARLASGVMMAAVIALVHLAGRELYARTEGMSAALALLGCLGLLVHAHETLAALSMGIPAVIAPVAVAVGVPLVSEAWHRREYLLSLLPALLAPLGICGGWLAAAESRAPGLVLAWLQANAVRFAVPPVEALGYWAQTLLWATWPAWPLALWTLWEARRRTFEPGMRMLIAACAASFGVLLALDAPREVYGLPLLLPLALLAGAGVPSLRRGAANALASFGVMSAGFLGAIMWLGWFAMMTGVPSRIADRFSKLEPGYVPQFSLTAFAVALAFTLAWLWLILKSERSAFRGVTFWSAGITLLWCLAMTLILPWIDYGKSYRPVAQALKKHIPAGTRCIESRGLVEAQRAVFDYHAGVVTQRLELRAESRCPLLLVQARQGEPDRTGPGWKLLWEGSRPRDRERFRLYQKTDYEMRGYLPSYSPKSEAVSVILKQPQKRS